MSHGMDKYSPISIRLKFCSGRQLGFLQKRYCVGGGIKTNLQK